MNNQVCHNSIVTKSSSVLSGRLKDFAHVCRKITSCPFILDAIAHSHIDFAGKPLAATNTCRPLCTFTDTEQGIIDNEIATFLEKGIIKPSTDERGKFISPIFRRKKDGSNSVIFNLSKLMIKLKIKNK